MATRDSTAERTRRISALVEAAMLLPPPERTAWVAQRCGGDAARRREVEALIARQESLALLTPENRERVSGFFHAALNLSPEERGPYLDVACAKMPDVRREVESLLHHASDPDFLEDSPGSLTELLAAPPSSPTASPPPPSKSSDALIGRKVGPYIVRRRLGEGGMGVVYLAVDPRLQKPVAVKIPRPEYLLQVEYRARLVAEARAAASLSHPNVAGVYALFEDGDEIFIVYEFVDGPTLRAVIDRGPLSYARLVKIFPDIARGLAHAHEHGILHRDIKPENIMIAAEDVPKIVDFGLAKSAKEIIDTTVVHTRPGVQPGTPAYMAPEQIDETPGRHVDFRTDIFAFGVTLYESPSGIHPFEGARLLTTLENIKRRDPPKLPDMGTDRDRLERIIRRCLQKDPEERYASTSALVSELDALRLPSVVPERPIQRTDSLARRDAAWWWRFHQVAVSATYSATLAWLFFVHALVRPAAAGLALFIACAIATVPGVALRLSRCFASVYYQPTRFRTLLGRVRRWVRTLDWVFCASLIATTGLLYAGNRPGTATALGVVALACLVVFLVVEPETEQEAFGELPDTGGRPRPATAAESSQAVRGTVISIAADAITVKGPETDMTFRVDETTAVIARSGATTRCEAQRPGTPGVRISDLVRVGDGVEVRYREMGGALYATTIRTDIAPPAAWPQ